MSHSPINLHPQGSPYAADRRGPAGYGGYRRRGSGAGPGVNYRRKPRGPKGEEGNYGMKVFGMILKLIMIFKGNENQEEGGEDGAEEQNHIREGGSRGRYRGRFRAGGYRPRYFNRPRRNTDVEEGSGEKPAGDLSEGDVSQSP